MMKPSKIYKPFDIIVIPFPFSAKLEQKKRPALVFSSEEFNMMSGHLMTAMITTAKQSNWPFDTPISGAKAAGLPMACLIRMKFFTVDQRQVTKRIGALSPADRSDFLKHLAAILHI